MQKFILNLRFFPILFSVFLLIFCSAGYATEKTQETPFLGIGMQNGNTILHALFPDKQSSGAVLIEQIIINSAADKSSLLKDDLITELNGEKPDIKKPVQWFTNRLKSYPVGETLNIKTIRLDRRYLINGHTPSTLMTDALTFDTLAQANRYLSQHPHSNLSLQQSIHPVEILHSIVLGSRSTLPKLAHPPFPIASKWQKPKAQLQTLVKHLTIDLADYSRFFQLINHDGQTNIPGANALNYYIRQHPQSAMHVLKQLQSLANQEKSQLTEHLIQQFYQPSKQVIVEEFPYLSSQEAIRAQLFELLQSIRETNQSLKSLKKHYHHSLTRLKNYYQNQDDNSKPRTDPLFQRDLQALELWQREHQPHNNAQLLQLSRYFSQTRIQLIQQAFAQNVTHQHYQQNGLSLTIAGNNDDYHYQGADLILDIGGNDRYFVAHPSQAKPIIIDISGNDIYQSQIAHQWGGAAFQIAYLLEWSGDDQYYAGDFSLGSSFMGAALLHDRQGNDQYYAGHLSMGAGLLGSGILHDQQGNDSYLSGTMSQAAGLFMGEGYLIDAAGDDRYTSSGWRSGAYAGEISFDGISIGVGLGLREVCRGGIGILFDYSGDDSYHAGNFSLGSGYYFALGGLLDLGGNDNYSAMRYGIGSAAHSALGLFWDENGHDRYQSSQHAIAGAAWDLSIALFVDQSGNDQYLSNGPFSFAAAEHNSLAIHLDNSGDDHYAHKFFTEQQNTYHNGQSVGIFINAQGQDSYPAQFDNHMQRQHNQFYFEDY